LSGEIEFWNAFCFVGRPDTTEKRAKRQVSRIILAEGIFNQQTDSSSSISSEALRRLLCVEGIESSTGKSFVPRLHFPSRSANGGRPELDHRRWSRRPLRSTNLLPPPPFMPGIRFWRLPEWELEVQVHPFLRLNPHHPLHLPLSPPHPLPNSPPPRIRSPPHLREPSLLAPPEPSNLLAGLPFRMGDDPRTKVEALFWAGECGKLHGER